MAERGLKTRAPNSQSSFLPMMSHTFSGLTLRSSSVPSFSLCFCFMFGCLIYLGHNWEGFSKRSNWKVDAMPWTLAWTNQSSCPSTPFCGSGDATGLAREESPLAGAFRCPPGNNREHPRHCHPLLHGHESMSPAWAPSLRTRSPDLLGNVTVVMGSKFQPCAYSSASECCMYWVG